MALFAIEYKMVSNCLSILLDKLYYFMHIHCISLFCYRGINYYTKLQVDLVATPTTCFFLYLNYYQDLVLELLLINYVWNSSYYMIYLRLYLIMIANFMDELNGFLHSFLFSFNKNPHLPCNCCNYLLDNSISS